MEKKKKWFDPATLVVFFIPIQVDAEDAALIFGDAESLLEGCTTFDDVEASTTLEGSDVLVQEAIECSGSDLSYTESSPFRDYAKFAWVSHQGLGSLDQGACGAYVYETKDGEGLVAHVCGASVPSDCVQCEGRRARELLFGDLPCCE